MGICLRDRRTFLAVPLTMTIQIALKINPKTEFIAVMLSNKVEK